MVAQTASDRARVGTQVIPIPEPIPPALPSTASFFLLSLSFNNDLQNPFYVPVIVLGSRDTEGSKSDLAPPFTASQFSGEGSNEEKLQA